MFQIAMSINADSMEAMYISKHVHSAEFTSILGISYTTSEYASYFRKFLSNYKRVKPAKAQSPLLDEWEHNYMNLL
jgi:hypothetical protein